MGQRITDEPLFLNIDMHGCWREVVSFQVDGGDGKGLHVLVVQP